MRRIGATLGLTMMTVMAARPVVLARPAGQGAFRAQVVEHFRAGQQDMRSGRPTEAVEEFQDVLRLAPDLSEARINLGLAYHLLGEYKLAVPEFEKGLQQSPNALGANIILGMDELKLGSPARAVRPLRRAVQMDPSNQQAWSSLAQVYLALGNYLEASRAYHAAFGTTGEMADKWLHLGKAYLQMSSRLTARMAHEYPNTAWAKRLAGDLLSDRHLWGSAAQRYQLALIRDSSQPGLNASLGNALLEDGKVREADRAYESEIRLDPANPQALLGLSVVELKRGDAHGALASISKVARTAPGFLCGQTSQMGQMGLLANKLPPAHAAQFARQLVDLQSQPGAHFLLAALYRGAGEASQAHEQQAFSESELKRLAAQQQPGPVACKANQYEACIRFLEDQHALNRRQLLTLGSAYFALRQYARASDAFASALAQKPQDGEAIYWLVRSYSKIADRCFSRLAQAYPNSAQARQLEAESYRIRGEDSRAVQQYQLAAAMQPGNASLHEALGELYLSEHQLPKAQKELGAALNLDPTRGRALYLMGRVEIGLQKPQAAISYLEKALRYDPSLLEAHASLGLAYLRAGKPALAAPQLEESASLDYYGDLHYMLYQAYHELGKRELAERALATSQARRRKTEARDQALIRSAQDQ